MKKRAITALLSLFIIFTGCAHVYHIIIDSINDNQEPKNKTYIIVPGNKDTQAGDLQFREFALYLSRALSRNGYTQAEPKQKPAIEIYLSYGIGLPEQRSRIYTVPVWGQTGFEATTYGSSTTTAFGTSTISTTLYNPEYGVTGYTTQTETYTTYPKYVVIEAYNIKGARSGATMTPVWKTNIRSEGARNELRHVFPILMGAASRYLGGNTGQEIEVMLTSDVDDVKIIKGEKIK